MSRTIRSGIVGAVAGLSIAILGELAVLIVRWQFPTDVAIVGFALIWAVPSGALVGAVSGWRRWLSNPYRLATVAAVPGLLAGVAAVLIQLSAV